MATKLEELRAKYPDYSDMSDEDFAKAFHKKFYSDIDFEDFAGRIGFQPTTVEKPKLAPEGYEIVETYGDGGRIVKNIETGRESYMSDAYTTSEPARVAEIRAAQGAAADIYRGELAQEIAGELPTRAASMAKGIPFVRGYVEPAFAGARSIGQGISPTTAMDTIREAIARREQEAPNTVALSRLGTGIATTAATAPSMTAKTVLGRTGQAAGYGGGMGILEGLIGGFGEGLFSGDVDFQRAADTAVRQAGIGGAAGLGFGVAGQPVAEGLGALYGNYLREPVRNIVEKIGFKGDAAKTMEELLAQDAATAVESAEVAGPYGNTAVLGPNVQSALDVVANSTGEGARIVRDNINDAVLDATRDLTSTMDNVLGEPTPVGEGILTQKGLIMKDTADARREAYKDAYSFNLDADDPSNKAILELFGRLDQSDIDKANRMLRLEGSDLRVGRERIEADDLQDAVARSANENATFLSNADGSYTKITEPSVEAVDYATRSLLDKSESLKRAGDLDEARALQNLARQMRAELDKVNPEYAKARAAGKDAIDQRLAADLGNDILSPSVSREDVAIAMESVDGVARNQLETALRNRIDDIMANAKAGVRSTPDEIVEGIQILKTLNTRAVRDKLTLALGEDAANELGEQITLTLGPYIQRASIALNSKTFQRGQVTDRMKEIVGEPLEDTIGRQGLLPTLASGAIAPLVKSPSVQQRIAGLGTELAPVLTGRKTPADLRREAALMSQISGYIDRASQGARTARDVTAGIAQGAGRQQARREEQDPMTVNLMRQLGLDAFVNRMR
jgi:hypothetical protein